MSVISDQIDYVWRDFIIDGDAGSGAHKPVKSEIRDLFYDINELGYTGARFIRWADGGDLANWAPVINSELALATANKQQLVLSPGTFKTQEKINLLDDTYIVGAGKDRTILWADPLVTAFAVMAGGDRDVGPIRNVVVKDLTIEGNVDLTLPESSSAPLIQSYNFENWSFIRVRCQNSRGYCMGFQGYPFAPDIHEGEQIDLYLEDVDLWRAGWARRFTGQLASSISAVDTTITVVDASIFDPLGGTMMIGTEAIRHGAFTGNTTEVIRGIVGTTAAAHAAGVPAYKLQDADGIDTKSGGRHHYVRVHSKYCTDKGLNPRCDILTMDGCYDKGSVIGIGLNSFAPEVTTTLAAAITASDTSVLLTDATLFPASGKATIESETITWAGKSTNTLTGVDRGIDGTIAVAHEIDTEIGIVYDEYEQLCSLNSCFSEDNALTGIAIAGGGAAHVMAVDITGCHVRRSAGGFNVSGGGGARMFVSVKGGSARDCQGAGIVIEAIESLYIGSGYLAMNNGGSGIELQDQSNGGIIDGVTCLANFRGILERGSTDWMQYGHIIARDSTSADLSICLAGNSTWLNRNSPFSNNQFYRETSYQMTWDPGTIASGTFVAVNVPAAVATPNSGAAVMFFGLGVGAPPIPDGVFFTAKATSNQVRVTMWNFSGAPYAPGSGTLRVSVRNAVGVT